MVTQKTLPRANHEKSLSALLVGKKKKVLAITEAWIILFMKEIVPDIPFCANHRTSQHSGGIFCTEKNPTNKPSCSLFSTLFQRSWIGFYITMEVIKQWCFLRYFKVFKKGNKMFRLFTPSFKWMAQKGKEKSLVLGHHWLKWSKRPQTDSLNFHLNEPGEKLAHGSSNCPKVLQSLSVNNTRGTGPCVLWGKTSTHSKNHPTATPVELKLNGCTIVFSWLTEMQLFLSTPSITHLSLQCSVLSSLQ